jgi:hypothetical protein
MTHQRLDDRIKDLCAKAVATPPSTELEGILRQLKDALHEHTEHLRKMAANYRTGTERRSKKKD